MAFALYNISTSTVEDNKEMLDFKDMKNESFEIFGNGQSFTKDHIEFKNIIQQYVNANF